tara:strand:- start:274 stop:576 length:303 start_codon:yes stop_codon:yes gene_type:complete
MAEKKVPKEVSRFLKGSVFDEEAVERFDKDKKRAVEKLKKQYEASSIPELLSKLRILFGGSAAPETVEPPPKRSRYFGQEAKDGGRIKSFKRGGQFKGIF